MMKQNTIKAQKTVSRIVMLQSRTPIRPRPPDEPIDAGGLSGVQSTTATATPAGIAADCHRDLADACRRLHGGWVDRPPGSKDCCVP